MVEILTRAGFFFLLIVLGYVLKKLKVLTKEDGVTLSRVALNVTLPAAIIMGFRTFSFDARLMTIPLISIAANCLMAFVGFMMTRSSDRNTRIFYMLELPAYNIGNFTLPFVSGILGAGGVVAACLFDMGNAPFCVGLNLTFAALALGESAGQKVWKQLLSVFTRPAFTAYCIMLVLSIASIELPHQVYDFIGLVSPANAPLAMIMIGLMLEFHFDSSKLRDAMMVNVLRIVLAIIIAFLFYKFAPFSQEIRKAVAITAFAPISSASPAFVSYLKGDVALVGFASTISIILTLIIIPVLFMVL